MMTDTKNEAAWKALFEKYKIIEAIKEKGFFEITSDQINEFRQARLMTKFDNRSQLPGIFKDNNLSILPLSRGNYIIGTFETFFDFNTDEVAVEKMDFPHLFESINYKEISSESIALNCAYVSGLLQDFTEELRLYPTINGRMSSGKFGFTITTEKGPYAIGVDSSQLEIDGGYEGDHSVVIVEAKNFISDDFMVRQLYYPYRAVLKKVKKKVRPVFLTYSNGEFDLREYAFTDETNYNSIQLVRQKKYAFREGVINMETIDKVLQNVSIITEPTKPFPQADSFDRVINLCELIKSKGSLSKDEITSNYGFNKRQTDYYANAASYLGLVNTGIINDQIVCLLTDEGNQLFDLTILDRKLAYMKLILQHGAFNRVLKKTLEQGKVPDKATVVAIMKVSSLYKVESDDTYNRRASTIIAWINWILQQNED